MKLQILLVVALIGTCFAKVPQTFGTAISQGYFNPGQEYTLYSKTGKGIITYFWCTEANDAEIIGDTVFRFYIDGDTSPSIEFTLDMLAGIGFDDQAAPWGNAHFGKGAATGGVYSTIRIPFHSSVEITGLLPSSAAKGSTFWWIVRGVENYQVDIGGYKLPDSAVLRLYKNENVTLKPLEYLDLFSTDANGAVWMVVLSVTSGNLNYLEGCMRMFQGVNSTTPILLSSGTEDYFQSAFYFDGNGGALFWLPEAGLTHRNDQLGQLSAYKVHNRDSLFFSAGGFRMTWRNGDRSNPSTGQKCFDQGNTNGNPQPSVVTTYAWVYEY